MRANFVHIENLLRSVVDIEGDFAEFGVWYGTTFIPMVEIARLTGHKIHAVDSFSGFAKRTDRDKKDFYQEGKLNTHGSQILNELISHCRDVVIVHEGFIPDIFTEMDKVRFSFVHLDVDQYRPTFESLNFLWERMVIGGIIMCHDWDKDSNESATGAIKDWMQKENVILDGEQEYSSHCWFRRTG